MSDQPIIIDTPDGIAHFQMARCIAALKIELNTGMRMSGGVSMLKVVQKQYGITAATRKKALKDMLAMYEKKYGRAYGS